MIPSRHADGQRVSRLRPALASADSVVAALPVSPNDVGNQPPAIGEHLGDWLVRKDSNLRSPDPEFVSAMRGLTAVGSDLAAVTIRDRRLELLTVLGYVLAILLFVGGFVVIASWIPRVVGQ